MTVIRPADTRRTETPNAVMTTLASPTVGAAGHAVWEVVMEPGATGPRHAFDVEQVWTVLDGAITVDLDGGDPVGLAAGDTIVLPPDVPRRIHAEGGLRALVTSRPGGRADRLDGSEPAAPAWVE